LSQKKHEEPSTPEQEGHISDPDEPGVYARARQQQRKRIDNLLQTADNYCHELFPRVMKLIKQQLDSPTFFQWDAALVRDGSASPFF
jgi:hypothetical protein